MIGNDPEEEITIDQLYKFATTVIDFFIESSASKPGLIKDSYNILLSMRHTIDDAYKHEDLIGMKMVARDMEEIMKDSKEKDRQLLKGKLNQAGLSNWTRV